MNTDFLSVLICVNQCPILAHAGNQARLRRLFEWIFTLLQLVNDRDECSARVACLHQRGHRAQQDGLRAKRLDAETDRSEHVAMRLQRGGLRGVICSGAGSSSSCIATVALARCALNCSYNTRCYMCYNRRSYSSCLPIQYQCTVSPFKMPKAR